MNIAIIPARGGSKRIPRKNIKAFCGQPMIAYAIKAAQASDLFQHVLVSTDDAEIQNIAKSLGAEVPFVRPAELANVHRHHHFGELALQFGSDVLDWQFSNVCCIYPGVPFIEVGDLKGALAKLTEGSADYCFPVTEFPAAIQRALKHSSNGLMEPFYPEHELTRTQDLEAAFYDAGQFYWGTKKAWLSNIHVLSNGVGFEIPNWRVVDIDTPLDWERAEKMAATLLRG